MKIRPWLLRSETFKVYTVGKNAPLASSLKVWVNVHIERMARKKNLILRQFFWMIFSPTYLTSCQLMEKRNIGIKSCTVISVAQKLKELWFCRWLCRWFFTHGIWQTLRKRRIIFEQVHVDKYRWLQQSIFPAGWISYKSLDSVTWRVLCYALTWKKKLSKYVTKVYIQLVSNE